MRAWQLDRSYASGQLDLSRAASLVAAIDAPESDAFAAAILRLLNPVEAVTQCTVFAYEAGCTPRPLSVADYRGGAYLRGIADTYARRFHELDGNRRVFSSGGRHALAPLTLHLQADEEIANEAYRRICYRDPNISERIALLAQSAEDVWLSVSLFRDRGAGRFRPDEIARIEALSPLLAHAMRQHYALSGSRRADIPQLMLARVQRQCPALSKRELDVLRGVLEGCTAHEIAERIGLKPSSVVTYQKRAFRRLGISSQRQLFALCLGSPPA